MSAHTPGPWEASEQDQVLTGPHREEHANWYVTGDDGTDDGVTVAMLDASETSAATAANARLIAAAPDLLEALRWAHQHVLLIYGPDDAIVKCCSAAIAKAVGP